MCVRRKNTALDAPYFLGGRHPWMRVEFLTIRAQRRSIGRLLAKMPSLKSSLQDTEWLADVYDDALATATNETQLNCFPETMEWDCDAVLGEWIPTRQDSAPAP